MDKLINKHIDQLDALEEDFDKKLTAAIQTIDIDAVLENPEAEMQSVIEVVKAEFLSEIAPRAIELGMQFAEQIKDRIKKDKDIKVEDSSNPKLNADG